MSRRLWVLALAVLMIGSAVAAIPAAAHAGAPSGAVSNGNSGVRPAAGVIDIALFEGYGYETDVFYSGTSPYSQLYFEILDTGADLNVNITITDANATRDGVGSPAFHLNVPVNTTTHVYESWLTDVHYDIPAALIYGGVWNFTASAPLGGNTTQPFTVETYYLSTTATPYSDSVVLPGEPVTLFWQIVSDQYVDSDYAGPYNYVTNLTMLATYVGFNGTVNESMPLLAHEWTSLTVNPLGEMALTIPDNATPGYYVSIELYATVYLDGNIVENQSGAFYFLVGYPTIDYAYAYYQPTTGCNENYDEFSAGQTVFACAIVGAGYGDDFSPVGGVAVNIHYTNESGTVTAPGAPTSQTSNAQGEISFSFTASSPPFTWEYFGYPYANSINYTPVDPAATAWAETHFAYWYVYDFYLAPAAATGDVAVVLNQAVYFPGQTISATWTLGSSNSSAIGTLTPVYWETENDQGQILGQGAITGGGSTGTETVTLPAGYVGEFAYGVFAENSSQVFAGWAYGTVTSPELLINPSSETYLPGSTVSVAVSTTGTGGATGLVIHYTVEAYYYDASDDYQNEGVVQSGSLLNGSSFTIAVPNADSPAYYEIEAWLSSSNGATLATSYYEIDELSGYSLVLSIATNSMYSDGSYQPGETLTFDYSLSAYGPTSIPTVYDYYAYLYDTVVGFEHEGSGNSGSFQLTIPSGQPAGTMEVEMEVDGLGLHGPNCDTDYCYNFVLFNVNPHPSVLDEELSPNSGVTVGWTILLVVIIVVALVLAVMIRRRRSPPAQATPGTSMTTPMSPPAPAPSGGAPPEWKEPGQPGGNQPPMPNPPSGAQ
ncbi:MAG TPA: hypothetical protein VMI55_04430 [Thermoplasmata archaeon]|nr:hypothetical protein [Thermoplasmata archaeon]